MTTPSVQVEAWVRGRFVDVPGAQARRIRANAWTVRIPRSPEVERALRVRPAGLRQLEQLTYAIDGMESTMVLGTEEARDEVSLSILL